MIVKRVTSAQARDTGLAAVLVLLLIAVFKDTDATVLPAVIVLVVNMIWPGIFRPLAYVWFTLANILRKIVSSILLTAVFLVILTPIGLLRTLFGADSMRTKTWKKDSSSVFVERDHLFTASDMERPY